jgi:hypothetical protein
MDKYSSTSWKVLPLPAEAFKTHNGYFFLSMDANMLLCFSVGLKIGKTNYFTLILIDYESVFIFIVCTNVIIVFL